MRSEIEFEAYNEPGPSTLQRVERAMMEAARLADKGKGVVESTTGKVNKRVMEILHSEGITVLAGKVKEHSENLDYLNEALFRIFNQGVNLLKKRK